MEKIWQITPVATRYHFSNLMVKLYWRWGAYYIITLDDGSSAFVSIDYSNEDYDFCTVFDFIKGPGEDAPHYKYDQLDPPHIAFIANKED